VYKMRIFSVLVVLAVTTAVCKPEQTDNVWSKERLTDGLWGLNNQLTDDGMEIGLSITSIYQINAKGGTSTNSRRGRHSGSYDLEMTAELQRLLGLETGIMYMLVEGGWPNAEGIDADSVNSAFGVNADAIGNETILVKELYYEGPMFNDDLSLMIGKIDFTGVFDASAYADNECSQFLNAAFVDNPTIPFPEYSLGAVLNWDVTDSLYIKGGIADAQAVGRETGFRTTFHKEDYFFYALETGVTSEINSANGAMSGTYRIGLWNDPQPKANSDGTKNTRDDVGFYTSCDQMFYKENSDPEDSQGLGAFVRYGYAPGRRNDISNFWSLGFQYEGLVEGRDDDILGFGFAHGTFSNTANVTYTNDYESAAELYYNAKLAGWLNITPSIQYITNPGGNRTTGDAVVLGVRVQMVF
jgi:porin